MRKALTALVISVLAIAPGWAEGPGPASVLGSDSILVNGTVFKFDGLDGVELHQSCFVDGEPWACGASATRALQTLLDGIMVTCTPTGETNGDAQIAVCSGGDQQDVGEFMVRQGWAVADRGRSTSYIAAEQAARGSRTGIWQGSFVEPRVFREDIAAVEIKYLEEAGASILADAQQALASDTDLGVFAHVNVRTPDWTEAAETSDHEVRITGLAPGFILNAVPPHEVFSWPAVARVLEDWRILSTSRVVKGARNPVWEGLLNRPSVVETADSALAYHRAVGRIAAPWIEQGRQPVLFVTSPTSPAWIGDWFHGSPPEGAEVTKKLEIVVQGYMGTIDGVDVYVGATPGTDSIMFPDDLLVTADYRKNADGAILTANASQASAEQNELVFHHAIALEWKADLIVRLNYPFDNDE